MHKKVNNPRHWTLLLVAAAALLDAGRADGSFVGGVESFDGTTLDTVTWESYSTLPSIPITQNAALTIASSQFSDYTTKTKTVSVGQKVSVDVTIDAPNDGPGNLFFLLTTNSGGVTAPSTNDSYQVGFSFGLSNSMRTYYQDLVINRGFIPTGSPQHAVGATYRYEIERLTSAQARFSVFDSSGGTVFSFISDLDGDFVHSGHRTAPHPAPLFISLCALGVTADFDNVTITPLTVPEPAGLLVMLVGALAIPTRGRGPGGK